MVVASPNKLLPSTRKRLSKKKSETFNRYTQYRDKPVEFIEKELKISLTEKQLEIIASVQHKRETNVQSCHGVGKTFISALLSIWWILCVEGLVITTAPTKRQVHKLLWGEVNRVHSKNALPGEIGQTFLRLTSDAKGFGFTANARNSNAFQGVHHPRLLVIEDEACGISQEIDDGASACVTGSQNRLLRIGNPITPGTPFQTACSKKHIQISAWTHPNVSWAYERDEEGVHRLKPEIAKNIINPDGSIKPQYEWPDEYPRDAIPGAISIEWIETVARPKGEASSFWKSRVEGQFPTDSANSLIHRSWFWQARQRYDADPDKWEARAKGQPKRWGLDIGDGGDPHARACWQGPILRLAEEKPTQGDREDTVRAAHWMMRDADKKLDVIKVDHIGVGSGTLATLLGDKYHAYPGGWSEGADDSAQFLNIKAEECWALREAFQYGEIAVAPLGEELEERLLDELSGIYWEETEPGKIRMEMKKKTRARLKRSPNLFDAVVMGYAKRKGQRSAINLMMAGAI